MENGFFTFQMEKLKQKENSEMVKELENGGIIMSLVRLSRYQAIPKLGERQGKWIEYDEDGKIKTTIYK